MNQNGPPDEHILKSFFSLKKLIGLPPPVNDQLDAGELNNYEMRNLNHIPISLDYYFAGLLSGRKESQGPIQNCLYCIFPGKKFQWPFHGPVSGMYMLIRKDHYYMIQGGWDRFRDFEKRLLIDLSEEENARAQHLFRGLVQELSSSSFLEFLHTGYLRLLVSFCGYIHAASSSGYSKEQIIVSNFRRELQWHYALPENSSVKLPSVTEIAARLKMNPNYLSQILKEHTGKSALDHIHDHVIEKAKSMLANPSLTIGEIAMLLGFDYPNYFARLFRKKMGVAPSKYRREML